MEVLVSSAAGRMAGDGGVWVVSSAAEVTGVGATVGVEEGGGGVSCAAARGLATVVAAVVVRGAEGSPAPIDEGGTVVVGRRRLRRGGLGPDVRTFCRAISVAGESDGRGWFDGEEGFRGGGAG
ncbi:hypothetical protein L6452_13932 [Arctium lappa]|uniref:Uncharacterized protein n=1 Tax=Arctium lappa TaxID=4217 RepID=A0ACB9CJW8_ARCLA|nr:hypothetical protein L6452_13932 [Arctium lappa]